MNFWLPAIALMVLAVAFMLLPLVRTAKRPPGEEVVAESVNAELLREQLQELDGQLENGGISPALYRDRRQELELRLLEDARPRPTRVSGGKHTGLVVLVALSIPFVAALLYQQLGAAREWQLTQSYRGISEQLSAGEVDDAVVTEFVGELAQYTAQQPSPDWLFLQARLYMQLGAYSAAAQTYGQLAVEQVGNADILARQVQALYLAANRKLDAQINAVIDQVLAINPHQPTVLGIRGMDAFENTDYAAAIKNWQQALEGMPPGSGSRDVLLQGIRQAQLALGEAPPAPPPSAGGFSDGIQVRVELASEAAVAPGSVVYILASAPAGGMPFAVVRLPVESLPAEVTLDDTTAMAPGSSLSRQGQARVTARVSASGNAMAQPGDWQGRSKVLTPDKLPPVVSISIDQQI